MNPSEHPTYQRYLQQGIWMEATRELVVSLLRNCPLHWSRLTRLEDKRIWEIFFDLDSLNKSAEEVMAIFRMTAHPAVILAMDAWKGDDCIGNEYMIGFLIGTDAPQSMDEQV
jgi:hypothetical protein